MVPREELLRRADVLRKKLQEQNLDGALLAQNMTLFYYAGTLQCQYVYLPVDGEPVGLYRKNGERAALESGIRLIQMSGFSGLPALLADAGFSPGRIGLEMDVLPTAIYFKLQQAFPGVLFADVSISVREARQVKSPFEIELLKKAALQADVIHKRLPSLLYEGVKELDLAAELEAVLRKQGHQGMTRVRGFNQEMFFGHVLSGKEGAFSTFLDSPTGGLGLSTASPQGAGWRTIGRGEPLTIDYGGISNGYIVDQTRLYSIGNLPDILTRAFDASLAVQDAVLPLLKPGFTGAEIFEKAALTAAEAGLQDYFMGYGDTQVKFVGHGLGLEFDEFPILSKGSKHSLEENMVVAVEPKFTFPGLGVVGLENTWQITSTGAVKISLTPDAHVIV